MTAPTFEGKPCARGHTLRYQSSHYCVACSIQGAARRRKRPSIEKTADPRPGEAWQRLRQRSGMRSHIARIIGLRYETTNKWKVVPLDHVFAVAAAANVPPERLRPDFFQNDPLRRAALTVSLPEPAKVPRSQPEPQPCKPTSHAAAPETDRISARNTAATDALLGRLRSSV